MSHGINQVTIPSSANNRSARRIPMLSYLCTSYKGVWIDFESEWCTYLRVPPSSPRLEPAATPDKSNIITYNANYINAARVRKAESFSGSRNPPPPKRLLACRRLQRKQANGTEQTEMVGLPIGPDVELLEIAADMVPGYVYSMWVSMQCIDKAVGEEARKIWTVANSPATLLFYCPSVPGSSKIFSGFHPNTRQIALTRLSVFVQEHSGRQQPSGSSSVAGLKCGTWGGCLGRSTSSVFSIEEESKGGLLRESWFQSTLDIPAGAEENTFLLYVMAPSAGIHRYLTHTFKVADVINHTATLQRADIPDNSIKTIEHCYSRLSSSIPTGEHIARWDQFSKDVSRDNVDETRRLDELIKTGDSDGRQNSSRSYADRHYSIGLQQANNHKPLPVVAERSSGLVDRMMGRNSGIWGVRV
ncbi:hypothetical protein DFH09DRAFT_1097280 [Mycena vulgaris]|nr:hypothetical protein DFH09DRAFT_1097280 [Mycena vulgaris]